MRGEQRDPHTHPVVTSAAKQRSRRSARSSGRLPQAHRAARAGQQRPESLQEAPPAAVPAPALLRAGWPRRPWPRRPGGTVTVNVVRNSLSASGRGCSGRGAGPPGGVVGVRQERCDLVGAPHPQRHGGEDGLEVDGVSAANRPSVRHSPGCSGGRHRRSRLPSAASWLECAASRPRTSSTAVSGVPSGTWVVIVTRKSTVKASSRPVTSSRRSCRDRDGDGKLGTAWAEDGWAHPTMLARQERDCLWPGWSVRRPG